MAILLDPPQSVPDCVSEGLTLRFLLLSNEVNFAMTGSKSGCVDNGFSAHLPTRKNSKLVSGRPQMKSFQFSHWDKSRKKQLVLA